ncbi:MAG: D-Ala-D-Ala carboxypeptidase family metallohydrolase [Flammeovirgaceae bacterium]
MVKLRHFTYAEFDSPDKPGSAKDEMQDQFMLMIDEARERAGIPFVVNSGFRTRAHHAKIYAELNQKPRWGSLHLNGRAADIGLPEFAREQARVKIIEAGVEAGFNGFGIYDSFIHLDNRSKLAIWKGNGISQSSFDVFEDYITKGVAGRTIHEAIEEEKQSKRGLAFVSSLVALAIIGISIK